MLSLALILILILIYLPPPPSLSLFLSFFLSFFLPLIADDGSAACRLTALLQTVQLLSHTKAQMGLMPTEADSLAVRSSVSLAKQIDPNNETVRLLEVDLLTNENKVEEALRICDALIKSAAPGDCFPYIMKANVSASELSVHVQRMQEGDRSALPTVELLRNEIIKLYELALKVDPHCPEAMVQMAHFKGMFGDVEGMEEALTLLNAATALVRTMEEKEHSLNLELVIYGNLSSIGHGWCFPVV